MKLRSLGIAALSSVLAMSVMGCSDDPTVGGNSSSSSSGSSSSGEGGSAGTGGAAGAGGTAGAGGMAGAGGTAGAGGAGGAAGSGGSAGGGGTGGSMALAEYCANGIDDDNDGATDCVDTKCATSAVCGKLIINEVDYDQPDADTAEFIELYNAGTTHIKLDGLSIVIVNGNGGASVVDKTVDLYGDVTPGQYFVLAAAGVTNIDPAATKQALTVAIQNGGTLASPSPDAVLLLDPVNGVGLDAICYECPPVGMPPVDIKGILYPLVAGTPSTASDEGNPASPTRSIIRYLDAADTGDDSVDWRATGIATPGAANQIAAEVCVDGMMLDEDADDLVDCADPDCAAAPACIPPEICDNGLDEDGDTLIDCADSECDAQSCGPLGLVCSASACVCPGGPMEMICDDALDNDCDGVSDCNDSNCTGTPSCSVEICDNGLDEDGDTLTDCADPDCDAQSCGANGLVCSTNTCACPGGLSTEAMCNDLLDEDCDGMTDCADPDCSADPLCFKLEVTSVDYPVIAHGGALIITGSGFTGVTGVTIGGINQAHTFDNDTQITIALVDDTTPLAMQDLVVTTPAGSTAPFGVTVIRLQINESDADTENVNSSDAFEFIEISTGVPNVNLQGYTVVLWNGNGDVSTRAMHLNVNTDANGLILLGNSSVVPAPAITFPNNTHQNGADAVAIHQADPSDYPNDTTLANGAKRIIDALVYDTADADDAGLLDGLLWLSPDPRRVQVDETGHVANMPKSIQRCNNGRRDGRKFLVDVPTPGATNTVTCP